MLNRIPEHGPDFGPPEPIQRAQHQDGAAHCRQHVPGYGRCDGRVLEKGGDDEEQKGDNPESDEGRPGAEASALGIPILGFREGEVEETAADKDY